MNKNNFDNNNNKKSKRLVRTNDGWKRLSQDQQKERAIKKISINQDDREFLENIDTNQIGTLKKAETLTMLSSNNYDDKKIQTKSLFKNDNVCIMPKRNMKQTIKNSNNSTMLTSREKINNCLLSCKLEKNTFLPVGVEIAEDIFGYLDVEDLISVSLTYKPVSKFVSESVKLWQEIYQRISSEHVNMIMKPIVMVQAMISPNSSQAIIWKRQVFEKLKYRPYYVLYSYLDESDDFTLLFLGASHDFDTLVLEAEEYTRQYDDDDIVSIHPSRPPKHINHEGQLYDKLQVGYDRDWRVAIETVNTLLDHPLRLRNADKILIVYKYSDVEKDFEFEFLKIYDDESDAIKFAKSLSNPDNESSEAKNFDHRGEIFDREDVSNKNFRIAVDCVKFWGKVHTEKQLFGATMYFESEDEDLNEESMDIGDIMEDDESNSPIERWKQRGYFDKSC
nr:12536_t:CDS:2 [Entrophospora candida]